MKINPKGFVFDGDNQHPFRRYNYEAQTPALEDVPVLVGTKFPLKLTKYPEGPPEKLLGKVYPTRPNSKRYY